MLISGNEKYKVEYIIQKIQDGSFNQTDIDNLFMKLRAFSADYPVLTEVGHFLAHNDQRDRGLTIDRLRTLQLAVTLHYEAGLGKFTNPYKSFPLHLKKHMKEQIELCEETKFKTFTSLSKAKFTKRVDEIFSEDKKSGTALLVKKLSKREEELLTYLLTSIFVPPLFTQDQIVNDLVGVLRFNQITFDENLLRNRSNEITICVTALLHNTTFNIRNSKTGRCSIHARRMEPIPLRYWNKGEDSEVVLPKEDWGLLSVWGYVPFEIQNPAKNLTIAFELFETSLQAEIYCEESMFEIYREGAPEDNRMTLYQYLRVDQDLTVNDEFRLIRLSV